MSFFDGLLVALEPGNLLACFIGALVGTFVGVLPGLGPVATIAMLLPITYHLSPAAAIVMLAGIYYGAQYGGSITAILVNIPGETSTVVTCLDGYRMAQKGRAGIALSIAAIGSFVAGLFATAVIAFVSVPLSEFAQQFGPAEYFALMSLGLVGAVVLARGSIIKALAMITVGLLLGLVGTDVNSGLQRLNFNIPQLADGLSFAAIAMGVFGIGEIFSTLGQKRAGVNVVARIERLWPNRDDLAASAAPIARGSIVGSVLGVLPGGGAVLSSFASYALEKKLSRHPEKFGSGAIEGVAGPESANNAGAQTSFIPMLTLGIPANPVMALIAGGLMLHGITPGPQILTEQSLLFWTVIASMLIGNLLLVIINIPFVGLWTKLFKMPYEILFPCIVVICCVGTYSVNKMPFDVLILGLFGVIGYGLVKLNFEVGPMLLGLVLGPMLEENFRRAMLLARGDPINIIARPISATLLAAALILLCVILLPNLRRTRATVFQEEA
ncbi:tripartite tricarboxylate transporter permease [Microvirga sp. VF16]|uniref:tripartite tricarboxylate transporter permease n=1 Tax=Microvirga sp. VF16 TaxID=2807101 RepID=UPI00193DE2C4|nr:tripartite tricarboxylate transporter permease [Microvirga sp. VF16]QRM29233.1 tripartite tricarboxylate transporter permease [Microvirga sp. VF16]